MIKRAIAFIGVVRKKPAIVTISDGGSSPVSRLNLALSFQILNFELLMQELLMIVQEFADIQQHWAKACIAQLAEEKLVSGYPGGDFRPSSPVTRAEFAVLMGNAFPDAEVIQRPMTFTDVPPSHWAYKAIKNASEKGFFAGYPDGTFKPNQSIPRVQAIIVLAAHLKLRVPPDPLQLLRNNFIDADDIPGYARNMMAFDASRELDVSRERVPWERGTTRETS